MEDVNVPISRLRRCASLLASAALLAALLPATSTQAAQGDCSQPSTNGTKPAAGDCLYILKVAVGSLTCTPACICAPGGALPTKTSDALLCLKKSVGQMVTLNCPCGVPNGDNFNDNSKDPAKWDDDGGNGNGVLSETSQRLQYSISSATSDDYQWRPWIGSVVPYSSNWEVQIDAANLTVPTQDDQVNSYGISIYTEGNFANEVFVELYSSHLGGPPARNGFYGAIYTGNDFIADVDTGAADQTITTGAMRVVYNGTSKVMRLFYDDNLSNAYNWIEFGSFSIDGDGGADANSDWGMANGDRFTLELYGFGAEIAVAPGKMYGDNFMVTGGVEP